MMTVALILDGVFLRHAWLLWRGSDPGTPMRTFRYSIHYLSLLFAVLLVDHYLPPLF